MQTYFWKLECEFLVSQNNAILNVAPIIFNKKYWYSETNMVITLFDYCETYISVDSPPKRDCKHDLLHCFRTVDDEKLKILPLIWLYWLRRPNTYYTTKYVYK